MFGGAVPRPRALAIDLRKAFRERRRHETRSPSLRAPVALPALDDRPLWAQSAQAEARFFAPATIAHLATGRMDEDGFYRVSWLRNGREVARHGFDDLLQARNFAKDRLRIQKVRKGVDRVRVIDVDGVPYFEYTV